MTLGRTGDLASELVVTYTVTQRSVGSTAGSATFPAGQDAVTVTVSPAAERVQPQFTFALDDGDSYDLGDPASVDVNGAFLTPQCRRIPDPLPRTGTAAPTGALALTGLGLVGAGLLFVLGARRMAARQ